MNIDLLSNMIRELIIDNDRVGLPGLGDFVAEMLPASFSDKGYTINPPYRKVFFRKGRCSNNLVAEMYAASNNVPQEDADEVINSFVKEMGEVLEEKKLIIFPGLGRLRATKENHIFFVADENLEVNPAGEAMEPISLKTHTEDQPIIIPDIVPEPQQFAEIPEPVAEEIQEEVAEEVEEVAEEIQEEVVEEVEEVAEEIQEEVVEEVEEIEEVAEEIQEEVVEEIEPIVEDVQEEIEEIQEEVEEAKEEIVEEAKEEKIKEEVKDEEKEVKEDVFADRSFIARKQKKDRWNRKKNNIRKVTSIILIAIAAIIVFLIIFAIIARLFPDFIDKILYTKQELEILNHWK